MNFIKNTELLALNGPNLKIYAIVNHLPNNAREKLVVYYNPDTKTTINFEVYWA